MPFSPLEMILNNAWTSSFLLSIGSFTITGYCLNKGYSKRWIIPASVVGLSSLVCPMVHIIYHKPQFQSGVKKINGRDALYHSLITAGSFALTTYFVKKSFSKKWITLGAFFCLTGLRNTITSLWGSNSPPQQKFTVRTLVDDPNDLMPEVDPNTEDPKILKCIQEAIRLHGPRKSPPLSPSTSSYTKIGHSFQDFLLDLNEKQDMKRFNCYHYNTTKEYYMKMFIEIQKVISEAESRRNLMKQCLNETEDSLSNILNYEWIWDILFQYMTEIDLWNYSYAETAEEFKQFPDKTTRDSISYERIRKAYFILIKGECLSNCRSSARELRDKLRAYETDE